MNLVRAAMDLAVTAAEISARQLYWRLPVLVTLLARMRRAETRRPRPLVDLPELEERLLRVTEGRSRLLMVHSSLDGIALRSPGRETRANLVSAASTVLRLLGKISGAEGTLAMPTHPLYPKDEEFLADKSDLVLDYDPRKTPSKVGLLTEMFRLSPGTRRSLHPLSSLACRGPLAEALLHDNLNDRRPLPHGVDSGYARICRESGLVVSIGCPLMHYVAVFHAVEDSCDADWPVPNFFRERRFRVAGTDRSEWVVRERRPEFVRCVARERLHRDWRREGILHESTVNGLRIDWASARDIFEFQMSRSRSGYPYYLTRWAGV